MSAPSPTLVESQALRLSVNQRGLVDDVHQRIEQGLFSHRVETPRYVGGASVFDGDRVLDLLDEARDPTIDRPRPVRASAGGETE